MRFLIGAACVAVIAFVGYYFWNEYSQAQAISQAAKATAKSNIEKQEKLLNQECDARVSDLKSWTDGKPTGQTKSFLEAREYVDQCLKLTAGTEWYEKNIHVKYW